MNPQTGTKQKPLNRIATLISIEADATTQELPTRLHLLRVGKFDTEKYGVLDITAADCTEMVVHFDNGIGRPGAGSLGVPVNLRHDKGGVAAAWINGLEFDGKDLWGTKIDWTGTGKKVLADGDYKCLSSEFTPRCLGGEWVNPENTSQKARNVFTGAGLTNIPMFTGNRPVMASATSDDADSDKQVIYINAKAKEQSMNLDALRVKASADLTAEERTFVEAHAAELSADEKTKFDIKVEATSTTATGQTVKTVDASTVTGNEGLVAVEASQLKALNDQVGALTQESKDRKHAEASATVDAAITEGKIKADQKDAWIGRIEADASMATVLTDMRGDPELAKEQGGVGDVTATSGSAAAELKGKIDAAMKEDTKLKYVEAQSQVLDADKDLAKRVQDERSEVN